jgi:prevent-host-death family protein
LTLAAAPFRLVLDQPIWSSTMRSVGAYEAKTHLSRLLEEVERGETITITRNGVPVARLVPVEENRRRSVREAIAELKEFSRGHRLDGITIRELIEEGRRY